MPPSVPTNEHVPWPCQAIRALLALFQFFMPAPAGCTAAPPARGAVSAHAAAKFPLLASSRIPCLPVHTCIDEFFLMAAALWQLPFLNKAFASPIVFLGPFCPPVEQSALGHFGACLRSSCIFSFCETCITSLNSSPIHSANEPVVFCSCGACPSWIGTGPATGDPQPRGRAGRAAGP